MECMLRSLARLLVLREYSALQTCNNYYHIRHDWGGDALLCLSLVNVRKTFENKPVIKKINTFQRAAASRLALPVAVSSSCIEPISTLAGN
jgi:hypothetical protein